MVSGKNSRGKRVRVLGIESSCDETAVALVEFAGASIRVKKNLVTSQIPIHQKYGGVVPEVAARSHVPEAVSLLSQAIGLSVPPTTDRGRNKSVTFPFDVIAVTRGPGLPTALAVGVETARMLAWQSGKPLIGVNHLEGHLASAWLDATNRKHWKFPLLALTVSGGHTELILMRDFCRYRIVGATRDDAAGEAFDKSAKLMGLPYPGGPAIAKLAEHGNAAAFDLPRPMWQDPSFDFSFSGLKTAVRQLWERSSDIRKEDLAASVQQAIVDVLVEKTIRAAKKFNVKGVLLVGGVSANQALRQQLGERIKQALKGVSFLPSDRRYITDNAAMIAAAGYWRWMRKDTDRWEAMDVRPEWELS